MRRAIQLFSLILLLAFLTPARAQQDPDLDARRRVFSDVTTGVRAIRRGSQGFYYVLTNPGAVILVFDAKDYEVSQVPGKSSPDAVAGDALDLDASDRIYVANLLANTVTVYAYDGSPAGVFPVPSPSSVVALPNDAFAVSSPAGGHLISVYNSRGGLVRELGELEDLADDPPLNRRLNVGQVATDAAGNFYFAFRYFPEPTVRKFAPSGEFVSDLSLATLDLQPMAQSARQEIARASSGANVSPREIISAFGVDPATQEIWLALGNLLLHFDRDQNALGSNRLYTPEGARLVPNFLLVESNRLLLGNDSLGIYEFPLRDGKPVQK